MLDDQLRRVYSAAFLIADSAAIPHSGVNRYLQH